MYYSVKFDTNCEKCGKRYSGYIGCVCPTNDSSLIGDTLNSVADSIDARHTKKKVENAIKFHDFKGIEIEPTTCPACGAYQTWRPPEKPFEPDVNRVTAKDLIISTFMISAFLNIGMLVLGFILMLTPLDDIVGDYYIVYFLLAGIIISFFIARKSLKSDILSDEEYQEKVKQYRSEKERYDQICLELQERSIRNYPDANIYTGAFTKNDIYAQYLFGRDQIGNNNSGTACCPSCKRELRGTVPWRSLEEARAREQCCPWCGAKLPSHIRLEL